MAVEKSVKKTTVGKAKENAGEKKNVRKSSSKKTVSKKTSVKTGEKPAKKSVAKTTSPVKAAEKPVKKTVAKSSSSKKNGEKAKVKSAVKSTASKKTSAGKKTVKQNSNKASSGKASLKASKESEENTEPKTNQIADEKAPVEKEQKNENAIIDEIKEDNDARVSLLSGVNINEAYAEAEKNKNKVVNKKTIIKICCVVGALVLLVAIILLSVKGCSSSKINKENAARQNTLSLVQNYIDKGLYDQALNLLNDLIIKNPDDKDAEGLLAKTAELKKKADANKNGGNGNYSVNIDTSQITDAMQSSIDSMQEQIAKQNESNAQNTQAMNDLLQKQQAQAENEKQAQLEQKAQQEAEAKQRAAQEAERKAKEEALAKEDAAFKDLMGKIDDEINLGKGSLNLGDTKSALSHFNKAKSMLPNSSSDRDKEYSAGKLSEIASALYDSSLSTPDENNAQNLENNAVSYAKDALEKDNRQGISHYVLGMNYFHNKSYESAEAELKSAIQEDTNNFMYYYQLGRVQATQKKYSDARSSFTSSIKYNSNYAPAQYNLGFVNERLNRTNDALFSYRKAYGIDTNYEKAYLAAARILSKKGEIGRASCRERV